MSKYSVGDLVIYRKTKWSVHPTPRAQDLHPAPSGEQYAYSVEKYWTVIGVADDQTVEVTTRRGKVHRLRADDPLLRRACLVERIRYRSRFPGAPQPPAV